MSIIDSLGKLDESHQRLVWTSFAIFQQRLDHHVATQKYKQERFEAILREQEMYMHRIEMAQTNLEYRRKWKPGYQGI